MLNHAIYFGLYEYLMICLQFRFSLMLQTFHVKIMQARKIHFSVFVKSAILFLVNLKNYNQSKNVALTVATCLFLHVFDDYSLPMHQNTVTNNLNYFHDLPYFASRHIS